jgi:hypothetical protein
MRLMTWQSLCIGLYRGEHEDQEDSVEHTNAPAAAASSGDGGGGITHR